MSDDQMAPVVTRPRRAPLRAAKGVLVLLVVCALTVAPIWLPSNLDPLAEIRAEAATAVRALQAGDLAALDRHLATHRGQPDFAYLFTSATTPRALGDALATVVGKGPEARLRAGVDPHAYELLLTDLAGTLALATHGAGDRALSRHWTERFVQATTKPADLAEGRDLPTQRAHQDVANKQNLLLLLARGYWSTEFLMKVTAAYWSFDQDAGDDAWPRPTLDDVRYAPAPNGSYLTDGVLALTAALTANPAASRWAFTEFQPGTTTIEYGGQDHPLGRFTHYLFFGHKFPESGYGNVGMTATLTALSSAAGGVGTTVVQTASRADGPISDSIVLQGLVKSMDHEHGGSILARAWILTKSVAGAVWHWVQRWGHRILDILSFAPPPIGPVAAGTNGVWYVIDGDYTDAGLSLAAVVPGLAFGKIAKAGKGTEEGATFESKIARVAKALRISRAWRSCERVAGGLVIRYGQGWTRAQRRAADLKVKALAAAAQKGELKKTIAVRSPTTVMRYKSKVGPVPPGSDVDHTIDLQLGGSDELSNLKPLNSAVNRSFGTQIEKQLKVFALGAPISAVTMCGR